MENELVLKEIDGRICTLTLNRPEKGNALSPELLKMLISVLHTIEEEDEVRVVVIRGAGNKSFCAGFDLNLLPTAENVDKNNGISLFEEAMMTVAGFPYPVIAMMNGYAFGGGCDLAVSCDIRIGVDSVKIGMVPAKLGVVYSASGLSRFIRVIGQARTRELFFTGRQYTASFLKDIGYLNYVLSREEIGDFTYEMAREISGNAPLSLKGTKRVLELIQDSTAPNEPYAREAREIAARSFLSKDAAEGKAAFFEKRKPDFQGK